MDSVRKDSQNFLHPADCCYKAKPCDSDDADARMVVRLHDYKTAYARISALEAERDRAVELLTMSLHSGVGVQDYQLREHIESFLASIGGEGK